MIELYQPKQGRKTASMRQKNSDVVHDVCTAKVHITWGWRFNPFSNILPNVRIFLRAFFNIVTDLLIYCSPVHENVEGDII